MRNLLRTGGSGVLLLLIMLGGGLVLWVGIPVGWLYIGSQVQAKTNSLGAALAVMLVGVLVSIFALVPALGWLNRKHEDLREARGLESHGNTALEAVMTIAAVIAVVGFGIWFFLIEGPGPSLAPR
jgi:heme/copper-type cytochrome/quinol oxidase subunit 2